MPKTTVCFFRDADGRTPVSDWLEELRTSDRRAYFKCAAAIESLEDAGHELRRPAADFLRDGIHELRARVGHVNYRLLYFFHGRNVAVIAHAMTKEDRVSPSDIERAVTRKHDFERFPSLHAQVREVP